MCKGMKRSFEEGMSSSEDRQSPSPVSVTATGHQVSPSKKVKLPGLFLETNKPVSNVSSIKQIHEDGTRAELIRKRDIIITLLRKFE